MHPELHVAVGVLGLERWERSLREPSMHLVGVHHPAVDAMPPVTQHDDAVCGE
jgi:hypothetical protein